METTLCPRFEGALQHFCSCFEDDFSLMGSFLRQFFDSLATKCHGKVCFPIELSWILKLNAKKNGRWLNFEKRKTVIVMIFSTTCWISGMKEYIAPALYEASEQTVVPSWTIERWLWSQQLLHYHVSHPNPGSMDSIIIDATRQPVIATLGIFIALIQLKTKVFINGPVSWRCI